tara:strand:+ start:20 stop:754 length:735 start_codon:yes stop_codon:yes gene_type:complete
MWVTYFENLNLESSIFRTYTESLKQKEVGGETTYVINEAKFGDENTPIYKVYKSENHGFICYCLKEAQDVKSISESLSSVIGKSKASIPLSFRLNRDENNTGYENLGIPKINPVLFSSLRSFCDQLVNTGIAVSGFRVEKSNNVIIDIESPSFTDLISDIELVRFFCLNFFSSDQCEIFTVSKKDSRLLQISFDISRKIKATEKRKLLKNENLTLIDNQVELKNLFSNSRVFQEVISVISHFSA